MKINTSRISLVLVAGFLFSLLTLYPAQAAPALRANGKIAFTSDRDGNSEIYLMDADGKGQTRLTSSPDREDYPTWSPDGRKIAFIRQNGSGSSIYLMDSDGLNQRQLTTFEIASDQAYPYERFSMSWSPDGSKIAFQDSTDIFTIGVDGSNRTNLTRGEFFNYEPTWSPDGSQIAFARSIYAHGYYPQIFIMNANGDSVRQITACNGYCQNRSPDWSPGGGRLAIDYSEMEDGSNNNPSGTGLQLVLSGLKPKWSPDEEKIIFYLASYPGVVSQIYSANKDGSGLTQLTNSLPNNFHPAWQPLPVVTVSGRVLTPDNRGLRSAAVTLTDADGVTRSVTTSSLGYYILDGVSVGKNYTISVSSRRFRYSPRSLEINGNLTNLDFVGME